MLKYFIAVFTFFLTGNKIFLSNLLQLNFYLIKEALVLLSGNSVPAGIFIGYSLSNHWKIKILETHHEKITTLRFRCIGFGKLQKR